MEIMDKHTAVKNKQMATKVLIVHSKSIGIEEENLRLIRQKHLEIK
jgi:hypothetical protein